MCSSRWWADSTRFPWVTHPHPAASQRGRTGWTKRGTRSSSKGCTGPAASPSGRGPQASVQGSPRPAHDLVEVRAATVAPAPRAAAAGRVRPPGGADPLPDRPHISCGWSASKYVPNRVPPGSPARSSPPSDRVAEQALESAETVVKLLCAGGRVAPGNDDDDLCQNAVIVRRIAARNSMPPYIYR
jgi:hypothetical protein